ncbi:21980_t:CDS:2, partial [Dentiscutata erythropus]
VEKQGRKYSDYIYDNFVGITNLAVAAKLYLAADNVSNLMHLADIHSQKFSMPKRLHSNRFAVRRIFYCLLYIRLQDDLLDNTNYPLANFIARVSGKDRLSSMINSKFYSVDYFKAIACRKFEKLSFEVKIHNSTNKYRVHLPEFNFENRWIKPGALQSTIKDKASLCHYYSDKTLNHMIEESASNWNNWNTGIKGRSEAKTALKLSPSEVIIGVTMGFNNF